MAAISPDVLNTLHRQLLIAVLTRRPLPGQASPMFFPDLELLFEQDEKIVSRENLAGDVGADVPAVCLSAEEVDARAKARGQLAFLKFRPAEALDDRVRLTLELHMGFDNTPPLPLGAVTATFAKVPAAGWQVVEPPAALGY